LPIEKIRVGDEVLSRTASGKLEYKKVIALTQPHLDKLLEMRVEGEQRSLDVTPKHRFWIKRGDEDPSWGFAGQIRVGDRVLTAKGQWHGVTAIAPIEGEQRVYNFEVEGNHNYFVGSNGLLVHNEGPCAFGNRIHQNFQEALAEQTDTAPEDWLMRTKPGQTGVDAEYLGDKDLGFKYAELKPVNYPNTALGNQVSNWGLPQGQTSVWWYNSGGVIGQTLGAW
jgi:hypothetical protein